MLPDIEQLADVVVETMRDALAPVYERIAALERRCDGIEGVPDKELAGVVEEFRAALRGGDTQ